MLADVNCHCKMTSVMVLDSETVQPLQNFFSKMTESWNKLNTSNMFLSFIVYFNLNRLTLVRELLSNNDCLLVSFTKIHMLVV